MYAIIDVGGRQMRVSPEEVVRVPLLTAEVGSPVTFDRVFALRTKGDVKIGTPTVKGARVVGEVVSHGKADKVIVYKYRRRKFYRRKRGHRQPYTEVKISEIAA
jgi:large subunit ribosomal protein L21